MSLGYNAFYSKTDYNDYYDDGVSYYAINSFGLGTTLGYPINETSRLSFGLTAQHDSIEPGTYSADEIYDFVDREGKEFTNFKANLGWSESTLNKGVLATRGHSTEPQRDGDSARQRPELLQDRLLGADLPAYHQQHVASLPYQAWLRRRLWLDR